LLSNSPDPDTRAAVQDVLDAVFENAGGIGLLQDAALLASVFGHVDFLLRTDALFAAPIPTSARNDPRAALDFAHLLRLEVIEPTRAVPLLDPDDFRRLSAYLIHFTRPETPASTARSRTTSDADASTARTGFLAALRERIVPASGPSAADTGVLEIFTAAHHQRYEDGRLVIDSPNTLGALPVVHIQNLAQPFRYQGLSEVEPLIPLQDELNTRLSDRANRVTLQSFKLLLAKGLDDDASVRSISPGQVWLTSNPDASIQAFGGDAASPSEDNHIQQIREAMDKASAVNALAAGLIRARVGQLSSENALRITLLGALKKTTRKQVAFGKGLARLAELILLALDRAGLFPTGPADRAVTVQWPDPIPRNERDRLEAARLKVQLGVPRERVLAELGYSPNDAAIT
ncbi:MAG: phage portal protein, partial [Planctomycetota bacterium]